MISNAALSDEEGYPWNSSGVALWSDVQSDDRMEFLYRHSAGDRKHRKHRIKLAKQHRERYEREIEEESGTFITGGKSESGVHLWGREVFKREASPFDHIDETRRRIALQRKEEIVKVISEDPIEDGYSHPAEQLLRTGLESREIDPELLRHWLLEEHSTSVYASILKCLGRLPHPVTEAWRTSILRPALDHDRSEVRDAAIHAIENWRDSSGWELLRQRSDREQVAWMKEYIDRVLAWAEN
jgi:hypothetical protein